MTGETIIFGANSEQTADIPGVQDCDIGSTNPDVNSGQSTQMLIGSYDENATYRGLMAFDLETFDAAHPFATLVDAQLWFYVEDLG